MSHVLTLAQFYSLTIRKRLLCTHVRHVLRRVLIPWIVAFMIMSQNNVHVVDFYYFVVIFMLLL